MSKYINLEQWPEVHFNYTGRPTPQENAELFAIMNIVFQISAKKKQRFVWMLKFPETNSYMSPAFALQFSAWLVSNKSKLAEYLEETYIYLENDKWQKWVDLILQNYTPVRPVHIKKL